MFNTSFVWTTSSETYESRESVYANLGSVQQPAGPLRKKKKGRSIPFLYSTVQLSVCSVFRSNSSLFLLSPILNSLHWIPSVRIRLRPSIIHGPCFPQPPNHAVHASDRQTEDPIASDGSRSRLLPGPPLKVLAHNPSGLHSFSFAIQAIWGGV